jgi:hypothetical protein
MRFQALGLVAATAAGLLSASAAFAETVTFNVALSGANESPPNDSPATGSAEATFDTETKMLTYSVTYDGLTGPALAAHIHGPADAGTNAGIAVPFESPASPIKGSATLTDAQAADLMAGKFYFNVHTEKHPGGELRGQIVK